MPSETLYAVYDNGAFKGKGTVNRVAEVLKMPRESVIAYARSGRLRSGRYTIERVKFTGPGMVRWAREWDRERRRLLAAGR